MNDDDVEYQHEVNIWERVAPETYSFTDNKFFVFVDAIFRQLANEKIIDTDTSEIQSILVKLSRIKYPQFKNPTGIVLGYYVLDKTKTEISTQKLKTLSNKLNKIEVAIKLQDVLRYANLWMFLLKTEIV